MSENRIERVAKAIRDKGASCEYCQDPMLADCCHYSGASAAIAAIYEPIEENIERVARALCLAQRQDPDEREILHIPSIVGRASGTTPPTVMKAIIAEPRWKRYTGDARAAIDAMLKD